MGGFKTTALTVLLSAIAGFVGGLLHDSASAAPTTAHDALPMKVSAATGLDFVDNDGRVVGRLGQDETKAFGLYLYDEHGRTRVSIGLGRDADSPNVTLVGSDGWPAVMVHAEEGATGPRGLFIDDRHWDGTARLEFDAEGNLALGFYSKGQLRKSFAPSAATPQHP